MTAVSTMRCLVEQPACEWSYTHERQVIVDAAWRQHYAEHVRGRQVLERFGMLAMPTTQQHTEERPHLP